MSYETGSFTDQYDLLEKIHTFLNTGGGDGTWTVDSFIADTQKYPSGTAASQKRLHIHKTATDSTVMYFHLKTANAAQIYNYAYTNGAFSGIGLYGSTGYSGAGNWDKETGFPQGSGSTKSAGVAIVCSSAGTYYFFSSDDTVVIIIEYTAGKYQWLVFGQIQKFGAFTGGQFFSGSTASRDPSRYADNTSSGTRLLADNNTGTGTFFVYLVIDTYSTWRVNQVRADVSLVAIYQSCKSSAVNSAISIASDYQLFLNNFLIGRSPNVFNGVAAFAQVYFMAQRIDGKYSPLGYIDIIRQINMQYKAAGDEIVLGADTWKIFPQHDPAGDTLQNVGFAVKKIIE